MAKCLTVPPNSNVNEDGAPKGCGSTPQLLAMDCVTEIPFEKLALAAANTQQVKYSPDEGRVEIMGVIVDGAPGLATSKDICDLSIAAFNVRSISYNPQVNNSKNTTTVVTAAAYTAVAFTREAFYDWSREGLGTATAFPGNNMPYLTDEIAFDFTFTNEHATAARDAVGSIVVVRRASKK